MTAAHVIDLGAVARARAALAALVAAHPSLTSPEAQARLAAALPSLLESPMSKPLDPNHTKGTSAKTLGLRMDPYLWTIVRAEVERLSALAPGATFSASDAARNLLRRAATQPAGAPAAPAATPAAPSPAPVAAKPLPPPEEPAVAPSKPRTAKPSKPRAVKQLALPGAPEEPAEEPLDLDAPEAQDVSALRADLNAARQRTGLSSRKLAVACGCSDHSVLRFLDGTTQAMPKWADGARAWLASVEPQEGKKDALE